MSLNAYEFLESLPLEGLGESCVVALLTFFVSVKKESIFFFRTIPIIVFKIPSLKLSSSYLEFNYTDENKKCTGILHGKRNESVQMIT